ncbi:MAG: sigma-70 family RNA polymerase sigma factor [Alphaproteobacteria bacterium]|jgi:RNA polymerase sigma-70 factor (ECF subfamily)|nr:sigma-70 family RNA polymerase sigma factor [Alphaproteobacteria bacterium]MDP6565303.1 sigma-70 family RNA polymerase sigma factor [Alphaproteobacteria bacterium]MDP6812064.1 sigma-70 family RNA polymerase sigma factor [Alphaproteobacteria bacterium]
MNRSRDDDDLAALRTGDRVATERFVREHAAWMLAVARRILRDHGHAEDAVQNAFAAVFKNLEKFDGRSALRTWMHRIVVNEALMLLRKSRRGRETPIDDLLPDFDDAGCRIEDRWTTVETPESLLQQTQTRARISELIDQLPDNYRIVLMLRDIEELSTAEVAELLDMSETNVKVRLHRARAALKKLLEPLIRGQAL